MGNDEGLRDFVHEDFNDLFEYGLLPLWNDPQEATIFLCEIHDSFDEYTEECETWIETLKVVEGFDTL